MKGLLLLLAAGSLVIFAAIAAGPVLERNRRSGQIQTLRAALDQARYSADSCKVSLSREERDFRLFDEVVDSLRSITDGYEDPQQGGVPQEEYEEYMETFDLYNTSVEAWQARADSLQANDAMCRLLIEAHNEMGDSIRRIQEAWREESGS